MKCILEDNIFLEEAIKIFSKMYNRESLSGYIEEAYFNKEGICICTDY